MPTSHSISLRSRTATLLVFAAVTLLLASVLGAGLLAASPASAQTDENPFPDRPHATDHVLVKLAPGLSAASIVGSDARTVFDRWLRVPVPAGQTPEETVAALAERPGVEAAELDYLIQLDPPSAEALEPPTASAAPNDPFYSYQWHFPPVQVEQAWDLSTGSGVVVAVVDSGITQDGEDLACHTFVWPYNAITSTSGAVAAEDDNGHGTHVAGTVAQCTDNGVGVAGVAIDAGLMPVKVLDAQGSGTNSTLAQGIDWARSHGADVINLSLGSDCGSSTWPTCSSSIVNDALEEAAAENIVIVAASGNSGEGVVAHPANHPDVIAVGAVDYDLALTAYSSRGSSLELVAPGGDLSRDANGDGFGDGVLQETFVLDEWAYYFFEGTSMASPHVAGAAALLRSLAPGADASEIRNALVATAVDQGPEGGPTSGYGLIQIHDAMTYLTGPDTIPPCWPEGSELWVTEYGETELRLAWSPAFDNVEVTGYRLRRPGTTGVMTADVTATLGGLDPGTEVVVEVLTRDAEGNWSEPLAATVRTSRVFLDTPGTTFYDDILWLSGNDITRGCNPPANDRYCPGDPVSRGQMAAFLGRALDLAASSTDTFIDDNDSVFEADIQALAASGITRGCNPPANDRFCPGDPVTRGQMAAFLRRGLDP